MLKYNESIGIVLPKLLNNNEKLVFFLAFIWHVTLVQVLTIFHSKK